MKWFNKNIKQEVTIVSALIDIKRGELLNNFNRGYEFYLDKLSELLEMPNYLVIFADKEAEKFILEKRSIKNTLIIPFSVSELEKIFELKTHTDRIRQNKEWLKKAEWLNKSPQATLEWYNPLVMSKHFLLEQIALKNPFNTSHIFWLDAGITNTVHPGYFWHDKIFNTPQILFDKFTFICYPYYSNNEIHGLDRVEMNKISNQESISYVARGGFFGGPIQTIVESKKHYKDLLEKTLQQDLMGTEESIFTMLSYLYPEFYNLFFIEDNGLLSTFFEAVKNNKLELLKSQPQPLLRNQITESELQDWHLNSSVHFNNTLNKIKEIIPVNSKINFVDVGSSTGTFFSFLQESYSIEKALLIEPLKEALEFSKKILDNSNIIYENVACGNQNKIQYLNIAKGDNNNLGVCSVYDYNDVNSIEIEECKLSDLLFKHQFNNISLIKIHTPSNQLQILEGLIDFIKQEENKPLIIFDYGYYESKDILNKCLQEFVNSGYEQINLYENWGGDILLIPKSKIIYPDIQLNSNALYSVKVNTTNHSTSTYILTYNFPQQLELLLKSFENSGQYLLKHTNLIVLNNSDDESTVDGYNNILSHFGIEQIKMGNLGICGGRQFIAEHFNETNANQMLFFEDDMLLHKAEFNICRNGFATWQPDIFEKAIELLDKEDFDFLKLSFTEFFGDNSTQWAWHNVPQTIREQNFPLQPFKEINGVSVEPPNTNIKVIKNYRGLSYAKGDIYYSNWPHIIGKKGNKKMFLDTQWQFPYEQTWMSHFYQLTVQNLLNPGLLLLTPINHNRVYHYESKLRKENKG